MNYKNILALIVFLACLQTISADELSKKESLGQALFLDKNL